jgi:hypothetical protein
MLSEELIVIDKLKKRINATVQQIGDSMMSGGVDSMEKYKYMLGQAHAYQLIIQEISNLLEPKEQKDEGNVRTSWLQNFSFTFYTKRKN